MTVAKVDRTFDRKNATGAFGSLRYSRAERD
jgi:hypothetical protein